MRVWIANLVSDNAEFKLVNFWLFCCMSKPIASKFTDEL